MFVNENSLTILIIALLIDVIIGDPNWLWKRTGHPVAWFAKFILLFNKIRGTSSSSSYVKVLGIIAIFALTLVAILIGILLVQFFSDTLWGLIVSAVIASIFIAQKSLYSHVKQVQKALSGNDLEQSRKQVAKIVGRDPNKLDMSGVARATIESTAENISDGIIAPIFWCILFGLPGLIAYKAINTADSTIGYKNEKYKNLGWATARLDDLVNYLPARLSGFLIAICAPLTYGSIKTALSIMVKDAHQHNSPNAGWPEASMAGILGIALAGPRIYSTHTEDGNWINGSGRMIVSSVDVKNTLKILVAVCILLFFILTFLLIVLILFTELNFSINLAF